MLIAHCIASCEARGLHINGFSCRTLWQTTYSTKLQTATFNMPSTITAGDNINICISYDGVHYYPASQQLIISPPLEITGGLPYVADNSTVDAFNLTGHFPPTTKYIGLSTNAACGNSTDMATVQNATVTSGSVCGNWLWFICHRGMYVLLIFSY